MDPTQASPSIDDTKSAMRSLLQSASVIYLVMAGIGFTIIHFRAGSWAVVEALFTVRADELRLFAAIIFLAFAFLISLSFCFEMLFHSYEQMKKIFSFVFRSGSPLELLYLALISAIAEEIFFRGAMVPLIGVLPAALLFALSHLGPAGLAFNAWTMWTFIAGLVFGAIYHVHPNLPSIVVLHFLINVLGFMRLKSAAAAQSTACEGMKP